MDLLGRYYTKNFVSSLLVNSLKTDTPGKILDLGVGDASLTLAAYSRWAGAEFYATEIEQSKVYELTKRLSFLQIFHCDTLRPSFNKEISLKFGSIDVAVCNPPYVRIDDGRIYEQLFKDAGCLSFLKMKRMTSEIVFFAHNITLLRRGGELGIIVSDSLITGKDFKIFRESLVSTFNLKSIIQLPDNVFRKTEARTHILILSKKASMLNTCELYSADVKGNLTEAIVILKKDLVERMDYNFFVNQQYLQTDKPDLKSINAIIKRGRYSFKELKSQNDIFFHSIHMKAGALTFSFEDKSIFKESENIARPGDILMCRVGKRSVGKVGFVKKGNVNISDCIYKITVEPQYQKLVWHSFICKQGQLWLKTYAHGVCSQVISKSDLEKFPLFAMESNIL